MSKTTHRVLAAMTVSLFFASIATLPTIHPPHTTGTRPYSESALSGVTPTTTTTTTAPPTTIPRASRGASRPLVRPQPRVVGDDVWAALSRCESGGRPDAVSRNGKYFGAFQFSIGTWRSVGGSGLPTDWPYDVQLHFAKVLQARSGWGQWPVCSRKLGLR